MITFWATWVVERIVVTHLRKPVVGTASEVRCLFGSAPMLESSTCWRMSELSNQKRQVIFRC